MNGVPAIRWTTTSAYVGALGTGLPAGFLNCLSSTVPACCSLLQIADLIKNLPYSLLILLVLKLLLLDLLLNLLLIRSQLLYFLSTFTLLDSDLPQLQR